MFRNSPLTLKRRRSLAQTPLDAAIFAVEAAAALSLYSNFGQ